MAFTISENWDASTPPALPAGWTTDGGSMGTTISRALSSPNSLGQVSGSTASMHYATYGTADPGGGAVFSGSASVLLYSAASVGINRAGITFRCSSTAMDNSSTSCYIAHLVASGSTTFTLAFEKLVNGSITPFASVVNSDSGVVREAWYTIGVLTNGSDLFNVRLTRASDGYTMNSSGAFVNSTVDAIAGQYAPDIASGSYYGIASSANFGSGYVYLDDYNISATSTPTIDTPRRPVIVGVPFQYFHVD